MSKDINPLGLIEIDHLEFVTNNQNHIQDLFISLGFESKLVSSDETRELFTQGQSRFVVNTQKSGPAKDYFNLHGEGVSKMSFLVQSAEDTLREAKKRGAKVIRPLEKEGNRLSFEIQGFGDVRNEFIERPREEFAPWAKNPSTRKNKPLRVRPTRIDHLTNNVPKGEMNHWAEFYERIYGMKEIRYFDIKGEKTGLFSRAMSLEERGITIPINEPDSENSKSQIQEFLDLHKGPGVQHIALATSNIIDTVSELQERGLPFLQVPKTYYEDLDKRPFQVEEDKTLLEKHHILADGDHEGYLLQIFSKECIGPLFFEYIQRKNHNGFGNGNFQALFNAIERDQIQRGYLR